MPNALLLYLALSAACGIGYVAGALVQRRHWEARCIRLWLRGAKEAEEKARTYAYARAAHAVGLWSHRIDRRADLMRHLESLATAPELGDCTLNPEEVLDATTSPVDPPILSAAPVSEAPTVLEDDPDDESRVVDVYRNEGFL